MLEKYYETMHLLFLTIFLFRNFSPRIEKL